ncbi:TPA: helix-turn-helix domain-containing protein [Proteus mirabilis]|nr:helix-turn-helix domain-containing protein [Proteus mirabilis]MBI6205629.1 helix-turn-helix domain-containing protein [Proteus mirabilis]MBI6372963.1 helix-turn-helix domain-containing protein [Proteus mirabilis]HCT1709599.1 helix-turn-helix domain-containing protein [Proteus mirabilis]HCT3577292.1 helix-turn-helix domain-containing protein [Proteus mirabilis]
MKRRGITQEMMHNRTGLSKPTLRKILKGDPSVSLGHYVNVLASLGLLEDLTKVAFDDELGRKLQDIQLLKKNKGIALWKSTFMLIGLNQLTLY